MLYLKINKAVYQEVVEKAVEVLKKGGIVAYPTETFYGLGVKFDMPDSLRRLCELKRRPREKAMPVIIGDRGLLWELVRGKQGEGLPSLAAELMEKFWPGPLTILLPAREGLAEYLTGNTGKVAVRIPGRSFALDLARQAGFPVTATSANLSGMPAAITATSVREYFDDELDMVVDGGPVPGGLPSTIVDASGEKLRIIREGASSVSL